MYRVESGHFSVYIIEVTSHQPLEILSNQGMDRRQMVAPGDTGGTQMSLDSAKAELWPALFGYFACLPLRTVGLAPACLPMVNSCMKESWLTNQRSPGRRL